LRSHGRPEEIQKLLNLTRSMYYYHLKRIRLEDLKFIDSFRGEDFATSVRLTIEGLEDCARRLIAIYQNANAKDADKIAAIELRYAIELDLLNVCRIGPTAVPLPQRIASVKKFNEIVQDKKFPQA